MSAPALAIDKVSRRFGSVVACSEVSLDVQAGEIHALIGPNGAGKSTLVAIVAGALSLDSGRISLGDEDVTHLDTIARTRRGLGRSFQVSEIIPEATAEENLVLACVGRQGLAGSLLVPWQRVSGLRNEAHDFAGQLGLMARLQVQARSLSHGERRRLELAMALALKPAVFLLDEPLAGMGAEAADEMIELLGELKQRAPILLVEHDMDAVFALADRLSVMVSGEVIASGSVDEIRHNRQVRESYLGEDLDLSGRASNHPADEDAHRQGPSVT